MSVHLLPWGSSHFECKSPSFFQPFSQTRPRYGCSSSCCAPGLQPTGFNWLSLSIPCKVWVRHCRGHLSQLVHAHIHQHRVSANKANLNTDFITAPRGQELNHGRNKSTQWSSSHWLPAAAKWWNELPDDIRPTSLYTVRRKLSNTLLPNIPGLSSTYKML